jgi:choline dehydrogenase-like flavoprotein
MRGSTGLLSDDQFRTLEAICDGLAAPGDALNTDSSTSALAQLIIAPIAELKNTADQGRFRRALNLFESRLMNLFLTGQFQRFTRMSPEGRERVLRAWATSRSLGLRTGFQTLKRLALFFAYARVDEKTGVNPHWAALGYPGSHKPVPVTKTIVPLEVSGDTTLDADVVVVGSGAGGGVVAAELAAAGHKVVILEKGGYFNETDFDGAEVRATERLYESRGILSTRDVGVVVLAGSSLGGGTTVNWSTSLRTPSSVLRQWELECGIKGAAQPEWQASLDAVCRRIHVCEQESAPNAQNQKLIDGCTALKYNWRPLPRNVKGCIDCGYCGFGCRHGAKQGASKTFLQDAFDHGARIVVGCHVDRIIIRNGVAQGVEGSVNGHCLTVRSKLVVAAGGSIHTPALLIRSGLTHKHIGHNLHLHPVAVVFGLYDEPIVPWHGTMQAAVCDQFTDLHNGYGVVLEVAPAHPGMLAMGLPWLDAQSHRELMSQAAHLATFIAITRDRDGGRVTVDRRGQPVLDYTPSRFDSRHLIRGAQELVRVHAAAGAHKIGGPYNNVPALWLRKGHDVETYVRGIASRGVVKNDMVLYAAHQLSSCRMGGRSRHAPVQPDGETVEVRNLFVADASALPTATGVNPMVSIMALAHRNAQFIKARL